jgi:hypothetical protein
MIFDILFDFRNAFIKTITKHLPHSLNAFKTEGSDPSILPVCLHPSSTTSDFAICILSLQYIIFIELSVILSMKNEKRKRKR